MLIVMLIPSPLCFPSRVLGLTWFWACDRSEIRSIWGRMFDGRGFLWSDHVNLSKANLSHYHWLEKRERNWNASALRMVCASYLCSVPRLQIHSILRKATLIFWWSLSLPPPCGTCWAVFRLDGRPSDSVRPTSWSGRIRINPNPLLPRGRGQKPDSPLRCCVISVNTSMISIKPVSCWLSLPRTKQFKAIGLTRCCALLSNDVWSHWRDSESSFAVGPFPRYEGQP